MKHWLWIGLILVLSCVASCSRSQSPTTTRRVASGQETPQLCIAKWHKAMVDGDKAAFGECFYPVSGYELVIEAMFDYATTAMELGRQVESRWNLKTWDDFDKANSGQGVTPLVPPWHFEEEWSKSRPITITDNNATVVLFPSSQPSLDIPSPFIQVDGQWFIDANKMFAHPQGLTKSFGLLHASMLRGIEKAKEPNATVDDVKATISE